MAEWIENISVEELSKLDITWIDAMQMYVSFTPLSQCRSTGDSEWTV